MKIQIKDVYLINYGQDQDSAPLFFFTLEGMNGSDENIRILENQLKAIKYMQPITLTFEQDEE
jgi:hypothetical protein